MVAIGIFSIIMLLSSGAYLVMISITRQVQGIATGVDNLAFALETMTREMRTGTAYNCAGVGDCLSGGNSFSFTPSGGGATITYARGSQVAPDGTTVGDITRNGIVLTDPSVNVTSLTYYASGTSKSDALQPNVTVIVSGTVTYAAGKSESFTIETGATMRGSDI